jgi:uncharacterized protein YutE (UPF0331/DUF86 family)
LVKQELIAARLEKLREYLKTLKATQKYDVEQFKADVFVHATAERYLQLAIECLLDVANHVISDQGFRKPDTYAEVFEILAQNRVIPRKLYEEIEGMAAFRNILVHDYLRLDLDRVYHVLQQKLRHIERLGTIFGGLLD